MLHKNNYYSVTITIVWMSNMQNSITMLSELFQFGNYPAAVVSGFFASGELGQLPAILCW
jgi:hypothetical protein